MSTTDPGIEGGISKAADNVESDSSHDGAEEGAQADLMDPSRWWFASTACPLLAGTFGPMANGFSICALVYYWRVYIPPGGTEEHGYVIKDPPWLIAINALSLVAALVGNASLLLNMAKRVRFSIAQPITIAGFLLAGVLLICDMAALTASSTYRITEPKAEASATHALSSAFYYAIFAAAIYIIIGCLMCVTVYGANQGRYPKDFNLTPSQRTLMLQTMSFIAYLLLGALVFSKIEGWEFLDAVYWADVTLLTVGLGDYSPATQVGRGLLFPFAIGGILIVGLVVGSIRSLVLERGKEKMSARITEKKRSTAINNVDVRHQQIKISLFSKADFITDPHCSPAQRREQEFNVMRKVQAAAERERRWMALAISGTIALSLWFVGAAIFMVCEHNQGWSYFNSLYFAYYSLLTIGYGDFQPMSNSGKPFYVLWSLLAVPSLTILISNMGDTVVKWFSDLTVWVGALTVLPGEKGVRATLKQMAKQMKPKEMVSGFTPPGIFGDVPNGKGGKGQQVSESFENHMLDRLADRLFKHIEEDELQEAKEAEEQGDTLERDICFYHYVLSRECRNVQKDLSASPAKQYKWGDWEYYLKIIGNEDDPEDFPGQKIADVLVPEQLKLAPSDSSDDRSNEQAKKDVLENWSWLSSKSPLMGPKTESEWLLERLSAALERELNRQRKGGKRKPPVSYNDMRRRRRPSERSAAAKKNGEDTQMEKMEEKVEEKEQLREREEMSGMPAE